MDQFISRALLPALALVFAGIAVAAEPATAAAPKAAHAPAAKSGSLDPETDKALYALGAILVHNLDTFQLSEAEFARVKAGMTDGFHKKPQAATAEASLPQIQALQRTRVMALAQREKDLGQAYLDKAASKPGANKTSSGLLYIPVSEGAGASPARTDRVKANYEGRLIDGTVFDSSAQHGGQPVTFPVGNIIPCWTEALQLMKVGGKSRIICPASLAYGDRGQMPKIMPGATLEFDIELVSIEPPAAPPASGLGPGAPPGSPGAPAAPPAPPKSP